MRQLNVSGLNNLVGLELSLIILGVKCSVWVASLRGRSWRILERSVCVSLIVFLNIVIKIFLFRLLCILASIAERVLRLVIRML